MRISDWSSDVCSSDLEPRTDFGVEFAVAVDRRSRLGAIGRVDLPLALQLGIEVPQLGFRRLESGIVIRRMGGVHTSDDCRPLFNQVTRFHGFYFHSGREPKRSEENTSELQPLMRY